MDTYEQAIGQNFDYMVTQRMMSMTGCALTEIDTVKNMSAADVYIFAINEARKECSQLMDMVVNSGR